jgi:chromosome segregation ATPase
MQADDSEALQAARARADELEAACESYERRVRDLEGEAAAHGRDMVAETEALRQQLAKVQSRLDHQAAELANTMAQLQIAQVKPQRCTHRGGCMGAWP